MSNEALGLGNENDKKPWRERALDRKTYENWREAQRRTEPGRIEPASLWEKIRDIFPDENAVRAAVQFHALTPDEGRLLTVLMIQIHRQRLNYAALSVSVGYSRQTVKRRLLTILRRFLVGKTTRKPSDPPGTVQVVRVRGRRRRQFYLTRENRFGEWRESLKELVTDRKTIRRLVKQRPTARSHEVPIRESPMNRLFGELIRYFAANLPKQEGPTPEGFNRRDWEFNIKRAQCILEGRNHRPGPWKSSEVWRKLLHRSGLCKNCGSFILRGFRLNGELITRRRDFCDDACKMVARRKTDKK